MQHQLAPMQLPGIRDLFPVAVEPCNVKTPTRHALPNLGACGGVSPPNTEDYR